ncbi:MAG: hypothetical protein ACLFNB_02025 [Candidatus Woesearchaeota archaeon]
MKEISTGIDRFAQLINKHKKLSSERAAKLLNLNKEVVEEWAELLEQENIVQLSYKFSKMYIEAKEQTKDDVVKAAKEVYSERDALQRKVDAAIRAIDKDTSGFEEVRKEFDVIQKSIKDELEKVRKESEELEHYDSLKKNLGKELQEQKKVFDKFRKEYDEQIKEFQRKYDTSIKELRNEEEEIKKYQKNIEQLKKDRSRVEKKINDSIKELKDISKDFDNQLEAIHGSEKKISRIKKSISKLSTNIDEVKAKNLKVLAKKVGERREEIEAKQKALVDDAQLKVKEIKGYIGTGQKFYEHFKGAFMKKIKTRELIDNIEKEKQELKNELVKLQKRISAFTISKNNSNVKKEFDDIEKLFEQYSKRKSKLVEKINYLLSYVRKQ